MSQESPATVEEPKEKGVPSKAADSETTTGDGGTVAAAAAGGGASGSQPSGPPVETESWQPVRSKKNKHRSGSLLGDPSSASSARNSRSRSNSERDHHSPLSHHGDGDSLFMMDEDFEDSNQPDLSDPLLASGGRRKTFTDYDSDVDDYEISDHDLSKIIIVTQTPRKVAASGPASSATGSYDRTGDWTTRVKMTQEHAQIINDGLYYYEQDLWLHGERSGSVSGSASSEPPHRNVGLISQEDFDLYTSGGTKKKPVTEGELPPPPPPPPTFVEESRISASGRL